MKEVKTFEEALGVYLKLVPDLENETYVWVHNTYHKAKKDKPCGYWQLKFIELINSHWI